MGARLTWAVSLRCYPVTGTSVAGDGARGLRRSSNRCCRSSGEHPQGGGTALRRRRGGVRRGHVRVDHLAARVLLDNHVCVGEVGPLRGRAPGNIEGVVRLPTRADVVVHLGERASAAPRVDEWVPRLGGAAANARPLEPVATKLGPSGFAAVQRTASSRHYGSDAAVTLA